MVPSRLLFVEKKSRGMSLTFESDLCRCLFPYFITASFIEARLNFTKATRCIIINNCYKVDLQTRENSSKLRNAKNHKL